MAMQTMIRAMELLKIQYENPESAVSLLLNSIPSTILPKKFWNDP